MGLRTPSYSTPCCPCFLFSRRRLCDGRKRYRQADRSKAIRATCFRRQLRQLDTKLNLIHNTNGRYWKRKRKTAALEAWSLETILLLRREEY